LIYCAEGICCNDIDIQIICQLVYFLFNAAVQIAVKGDGAIVVKNQQFADAGMGIGMIVAGLASVIIGEAIFGKRTLLQHIIAVVCGSVVYRAVLALVLRLGLAPTDFKLLTALIVVVALASPQVKGWLGKGKNNRKGETLDA
jgi:ABC-type uncharacterized transport system permease subunit